MSKTLADPILGTHNGALGCACLHGIACHTAISIIWHTKMLTLQNEEWNWKWIDWIDHVRSVQVFNSNSLSIQNISIQFQFNSCWIELIINSNSIHELIRALFDNQPLQPNSLFTCCFIYEILQTIHTFVICVLIMIKLYLSETTNAKSVIVFYAAISKRWRFFITHCDRVPYICVNKLSYHWLI